MPTFHVRERAKADLRSIGRYTQATWGREQRNRYLAQLDAALHLLAEESERGRACEEIRPGYRKYRVGRHVVFYRTFPTGIEVIRVLYDSMDVESRLAEE